MTLLELHDRIVNTMEHIRERGQNPDEIPVTLQLAGEDDQWGHEDMDVLWDNNTQCTGCVIIATREGH